MTTSARDIFASAEDFNAAAHALSKLDVTGTSERDPKLLVPIFVNSAFAMELYCKSIILDAGDVFPRKHTLSYLFASLTREVRDHIRERYDNDPHHVSLVQFYQKTKRDITELGLDDILLRCGDAFERWRSRHKSIKSELLCNDFGTLRQILREYILGRHPKWIETSPDFFRPGAPADQPE